MEIEFDFAGSSIEFLQYEAQIIVDNEIRVFFESRLKNDSNILITISKNVCIIYFNMKIFFQNHIL